MIEKNIFIILLIVLVGCTKKETPQEIYDREVKLLFNFDEYNDEILISSQPIQIDQSCVETIKTNSLNFSKSDLSEILKDLEQPLITKWSDSYFKNGKVLDKEKIRTIFKGNLDDGWADFHKEYGNSYLELSAPIFFNKYSCCLVFGAAHCGSLCGGGELILYQKNNDKWEIIKRYCNYVN